MIDNEQFIAECKKAKCSYKEYIVIGNKQVEVKAQLYQSAYKDTTFFGKFNLSYITFETENDIKYRNKNFDYYKVVNGVEQKIGHFYVTEVQDDDTNESVKVTAYDNGIKFLNPYSTNLDFGNSITLYQLLQDCCQTNGITLENESITNGDFIVDNNQFVNGETAGDVICAIAQISGNFAFINWKGNLELRFVVPTNETIEDYVELEDKRDTQPITCLQIGLSEVEGENVVRKDQALIEQYGENWLIINDNPLVYTPAKRIAVIDNIFNKVKGFGYSSFVAKETFDHYRELGDLVTLKNKNGDSISSIVLRISTDYDAVTLEAPSITNAEVDYLYIGPDNMVQQQTKIQVDKANKKIGSLVTQIGDRSQKTTSITQDLDTIQATIGDIENLTEEKDGYGTINFSEINTSEPIYLQIYPMSTDISRAYVSKSSFIGQQFVLRTRTLQFINTTTNTTFSYELPDDLYRTQGVYDEFILDYLNNECKIIKRIGKNEDGSLYILDTPVTTTYEYPTIALTDGDYIIKLLGYTNPYIRAKLMKKNELTTQFATQVEMNSAINMSSQNITASVERTYLAKTDASDIYETQEDARNARAELQLGIEQTQDDIVSYINASADVINLTAGRLIITSGNFKLDDNGNITCTGGTIGGFTISSTAIYNNKTSLTDNLSDGVYIGTDGICLGSGIMQTPFTVTPNGKMTCGNAEITGKIIGSTIQGGTIQGSVIKFAYSDTAYTQIDSGGIDMYVSSSYAPEIYMKAPNGNTLTLTSSEIISNNLSWLFSPIMYFNKQTKTTLGAVFAQDIQGLRANSVVNPSAIYFEGPLGTTYGITIWSSDASLKKDIEDTKEIAIKKINQIQHKQFAFKRSNKKIKCGYIAQELEQINPDFVEKIQQSDGSYMYQVNEPGIIPYITKAIQELSSQIQEIKEKVGV